MSKLLKTILMPAALTLIGSAQAQTPSKQPCSFEGRVYADGATNPIGQVCVAGAWGMLLTFNPPSSASMLAEPFLMGQPTLRERFATV